MNNPLYRLLDLLKVVLIISPIFELGKVFVRSLIWHAPVLKSEAGQEIHKNHFISSASLLFISSNVSLELVQTLSSDCRDSSRKLQHNSSLLMPCRAQNCIFNAVLGLIFLPERSLQNFRSQNCCCKIEGQQGYLFLLSYVCWAEACIECLSLQAEVIDAPFLHLGDQSVRGGTE